jgi:hypothetical protein
MLNNKFAMLRTFLLFSAIFFTASFAYGACSGPAANAGNLQMIGTVLYYCDGTNWLGVNGTSTGVSCTGNTGRIENRSGELQYCNGTNWIATANAIDHADCEPTYPAGYFYYSTTNSGAYYSNLTFYWFCDGGTPRKWRRMGTGVL